MKMKTNEKQWIRILDEAGVGIKKPFTKEEAIDIIRYTPQVRSAKQRYVPNFQKMKMALLKSQLFEIKERYTETRKPTTWIKVKKND